MTTPEPGGDTANTTDHPWKILVSSFVTMYETWHPDAKLIETLARGFVIIWYPKYPKARKISRKITTIAAAELSMLDLFLPNFISLYPLVRPQNAATNPTNAKATNSSTVVGFPEFNCDMNPVIPRPNVPLPINFANSFHLLTTLPSKIELLALSTSLLTNSASPLR